MRGSGRSSAPLELQWNCDQGAAWCPLSRREALRSSLPDAHRSVGPRSRKVSAERSSGSCRRGSCPAGQAQAPCHGRVLRVLPHPAPADPPQPPTVPLSAVLGVTVPLSPAVCGLCRRADCDPAVVGQLCSAEGLCVHENCLYHSSGLLQRGADEEGFYGFLFPDIREQLRAVANKRCCICQQPGASVICHRQMRRPSLTGRSRSRRCSRAFHLPCGSESGCISQYFGEYKSFCWKHQPVQQLRGVQQHRSPCYVCFEEVSEQPCYGTLVCPACASAWFHRGCIRQMALAAGLHHLRCPICRNETEFRAEMLRLGIKIPDRDAAWELDDEEMANLPRSVLCSSCSSWGNHQLCTAPRADADSWQCSHCSNMSAGDRVQQLGRQGPRGHVATTAVLGPEDLWKEGVCPTHSSVCGHSQWLMPTSSAVAI
ncbi:PHD finger protein 7-like [Heliangelus exortis]|uniref:PHD finger protein 7-like n=1 Tax=Heliangelus exortis TaxID=472823 RepID=UPI003A8D7094